MQKKYSVLMLVENAPVPPDVRVWNEACALSQWGFQVHVICPIWETLAKESYICIDGIHIYRYKSSAGFNWSGSYFKEFANAMFKTLGLSIKIWWKHGFDVIHAANPPDTFFAIGLLYRLIGKIYIFDQHDLSPEIFCVRFQDRMKWLYKMLKFFERCSYLTANLIITTNDSQKCIAIERGHCASDKVFVVRNGPDTGHFNVLQPEPELKRGKRFLLTYLGVMGAQDGADYALRALNELVNQHGHQDIMLAFLGDGEQLQTLKKLAHELGLDQYVHFTGWVAKKDLLRYLSVTDIGLSPDPSNELNDRSTMLKTMEYMAMGKPVVAFDLPETRYTAQDAALYATPNSPEDFADKIEVLLHNKEMRQQMGDFGRKRVEEKLCWERTKVNLWRAYQKLLPGCVQYQQEYHIDSEQVVIDTKIPYC